MRGRFVVIVGSFMRNILLGLVVLFVFIFLVFSLIGTSEPEVVLVESSFLEGEFDLVSFYSMNSDLVDVYSLVESLTGVSADILRGIARVESDERDYVVGDDGISVGRMQINERWREERVRKYGEYDPRDAFDAVFITAKIFNDNLKILGSEDLAIAAHRQGVNGVLKNGASEWYIDRVRKYSEGFK